ncbi:hypothetical protein SUGI_0938470 [Cryptomeria japonica]|uniref:protein MEI2-like 5 n=1 Tax=Cryptomeria japonica TaxID=3369 RepID=UPI0024149CE1|nr:protein MEI2-like 5 [Cryptomeria japonica]XP_057864030.1 protein MEI2-like 5 [Cryptomeria japonica]XP_057864031.1 protein MEI2-like 5 [Cryptomeria japonica]XP_057864032.1 protein MEI2-like 5 [Cryptomeria japonica]XP_057864033.1 protein MEI2-like 5 [Cryptomeria japonica]XP_057864034.1 protein MEI2-like 5 [Cryptomeria japonica]GLJ44646.1 hypothetical protein SUGI_0938470 [Cryptomeria japonica]
MGQSVEQSKDFQGSPRWIPTIDIFQTKENTAYIPTKLNDFHVPSDTSLFSRSLPVLFHGKLNLSDKECIENSNITTSCHINEKPPGEDPLVTLQGMEIQGQGFVLPDDEEELLAGIMDDFDLTGLPSQVEELEEYDDLFSSGGGMELDSDSHECVNYNYSNIVTSDYIAGGGANHHGISNVLGPVIGEHPYGEHPSRTLFVRNINSNVEDSELRALFEQHGDIRMLYTTCKHRGFVMISYYDIRSARDAMRNLQNKPLRRRKLDIHFSIPKDNPSDKDINQGTLVAFNLDPSVSNDDLRQIFGAHGEVKEIRETPHKRHHKFIEFYDVRHAEAALRALNRSEIAGKRIKLEPSRPGGARRSYMQCLSQEPEQDENRPYQQQTGSPLLNSPPGPWEHFSTPSENGSVHSMTFSRGFGNINYPLNKPSPGIGASLPPFPSTKSGIVNGDFARAKQVEQMATFKSFTKPGQLNQSHSFPDYENGMLQVMHYNSSGSVPVPQSSTPFGHHEGTGAGSSGSVGYPSPSSAGSGTFPGHHYLWGSASPYSHHIPWPGPSHGHTFNSGGAQPYSMRQIPYLSSSMTSRHYHVGSAPSSEPSLERHFGYITESPDLSFVSPSSLGTMSCTTGSPVMGFGGHGVVNAGVAGMTSNGSTECGSPIGVLSPQRKGRMFTGAGLTGTMANFGEGLNDRGRSRRGDSSTNQTDNKKQYQLDLEKIMHGEDTRTTIMIKNIPNKYTSKMLILAIDEHHHGTYDFLYLPIDFKNKCNVGYAFINMTAPSHIIPFYQAFNGKKWEKFNSEKVASLAYARIQGKAALISHFQNSSLLNEDKRCRPIVINPEAGNQEVLPMGLDLKVYPVKEFGDGGIQRSPTENVNNDELLQKVDNTTNDNDFNEISSEISKLLDLS